MTNKIYFRFNYNYENGGTNHSEGKGFGLKLPSKRDIYFRVVHPQYKLEITSVREVSKYEYDSFAACGLNLDMTGVAKPIDLKTLNTINAKHTILIYLCSIFLVFAVNTVHDCWLNVHWLINIPYTLGQGVIITAITWIGYIPLYRIIDWVFNRY